MNFRICFALFLFTLLAFCNLRAQNTLADTAQTKPVRNAKAVTFHYLSPALGYLAFSYENQLGKKFSIVPTVGYVGLPVSLGKGKQGFIASVQPRFYFVQRMLKKHPLNGLYIGLAPTLSFYNEHTDGYDYYLNPQTNETTRVDYTIDKKTTSFAMIASFGVHIVAKKRISIDVSHGIGYSFSNTSEVRSAYAPQPVETYYDDTFGYYFSHIKVNPLVTYQINFTIGYAFY